MQGTFYFILIFSGVLILFSMLRTKRFFAALLLSVLQGIVAFFAANFVGGFFGVHIPMNWYSLSVAAVGCTPGVILLLLLQTIFSL